MTKLKVWLSVVAAAVLGVLALIFKSKLDKGASAEASLISADSAKKDAVLAERQTNVASYVNEVKKKAEEEKAKKLNAQETEEFLKKL